MKRKLTAIAAMLLMNIFCICTGAAGTGTLSWSDSAALCSVSDVYYIAASGEKAFVAGQLTRIPAGARVYMTIRPEAMRRLAEPCLAEFDDGTSQELVRAGLPDPENGGGIFSMCMRVGDARLRLDCAPQGGTREGAEYPAARLPCGAVVHTAAYKLRLRAKCDADADILGRYESGTHVAINAMSADGEWAMVEVDADGKTGWMKAEYLTPDAPPVAIKVIIIPEIPVQQRYFARQKYENKKAVLVFKNIMFM